MMARLLFVAVVATFLCGAFADHQIPRHYCHGCEAMGIEGMELTPAEKEWREEWPANYQWDPETSPENYQRQKCRLRNMHFFNDTKYGACSMGSCKVGREERLATMQQCTVSCCAYCSEDQPVITRAIIVTLKIGCIFYMLKVGMFFWKVAQPHYAQAKKKKQLVGTFTIIVTSLVCVVCRLLLHSFLTAYHLTLLANGGSAEFLSFMFDGGTFLSQFNCLDFINKYWEPYLNLFAVTCFVTAQLNLIFLWAEIICPDAKGKKQMKSITNIKKSKPFLQKLIGCYFCCSAVVTFIGVYTKLYLLCVVWMLFSWTSMQCYVCCQFIRKGGKVVKELKMASKDNQGDAKLDKLGHQVTSLARSVGFYGVALIFLLWGPQLMLISGIFGAGLKSSLSMSWPQGGSLRCWYEAEKEIFTTLQAICQLRVLTNIALVLEKKTARKKIDKLKDTEVSEGGDERGVGAETNSSASSSGTTN